jgi:glutathione synthase/RimK-type ligase-like ATP-grasp enzyme
MILLISNTQDLTCDFVVREIRERGLEFARLNTDEFPTNGFGVATFGRGQSPRRVIRWKNRERILDFDQISSVLYRRPVPPVPDDKITNLAVRKFCQDESYDFLRGMWFSLNAYWISHPEAIRRAEHKITQLTIAQQLSFNIPKTLVTNDPDEVRAFFSSCPNGIVVKPLYVGFVDDPNQPRNIFTTLVSEKDLQDVETVCLAPSIFQERVLKVFDIRVTVIGQRVFAAQIMTDSLPSHIPDWRFAPIDTLRHQIYCLPSDIKESCLRLVESLGLEFGAIDLAVDQNGDHVFFEINANGQWAWLETILDLPISKCIVDCLAMNGSVP